MTRKPATTGPSLFGGDVPSPLADLLRPQTLDEVVGQDHLFVPNAPLERMRRTRRVTSLILWGPPGTGKTTIARALAKVADAEFVALSAVRDGVPELKRVISDAKVLREQGRITLCLIDELHRLNRTQQDAALGAVENGDITLIGATTETPSFSINKALLSRAQVVTLHALDDVAMEKLIQRAEAHYGQPLAVTPGARAAMIQNALSDGRYLLGMVEAVYLADPQQPLDEEALAVVVQRRLPVHDRGDAHFNSLSALHKSLRGSSPDAALYYAARMIDAGEDPNTIFRELAKCCGEEVGMADPQAAVQVLTNWQLYERLGLPEGRIPLSQAIIYVATAPKSAASYLAINEAMALAASTSHLPLPPNILNAPTDLHCQMGQKDGYMWDHDWPDAYAGNEFFPHELRGENEPTFYRPNERGLERKIIERLAFWADLRRDRKAGRP